MTRHSLATILALGLLVAGMRPALADIDYVSTDRPAILYDAPSEAANKVAVVTAGYPFQVIVRTDTWLKVLDPSGELTWIEAAATQGKPHVIVASDQAAVLDKPQADASVLYRVAKGVLLELIGKSTQPGWLKVRHPQGGEGYLTLQDIWGQ